MTGDLGERIAKAATSFVGTPFLLGGRDPATGLDCIGLVAASLEATGIRCAFPSGYGLRNTNIETLLAKAVPASMIRVSETVVLGDILMLRPGPGQHHFGIAVNSGFVHAHAGLRRVVMTPGSPSTPALAHWRAQPEQQEH